jgi:branched-chain amino acid transport system permease protein
MASWVSQLSAGPKMTLSHSRLLWTIAIVTLALMPLVLPGYWVYQLSLAGANVLAALGLNILTGYAGQISLGHAGFLAIGSYIASTITAALGGNGFWLSIPLAGVLTGLAGLVLFIPALRLGTIYLAIATLGFGAAVSQVLIRISVLTGTYEGIHVPIPMIGEMTVERNLIMYFSTAVIVLFLVWIARNVIHSKLGRAFIAIRDKELAAEAMGISLPRYKAYAFVLSALYTGIAGALHAHIVGISQAEVFHLGTSIQLFSMIVLGGLASLPGSILGALFLSLLPELLKTVITSQSYYNVVYGILYGGSLVLVIIFMPYGIWGALVRFTFKFPRLRKFFAGA